MFNLLSFCSAWHGLYIYVYSFHVSGINFPKYWTECCSPSSLLVETLWSPTTMLSIKFPEVWISMTANRFCLCVLWKACITWHFLTTNRKLTFSWKITLQGAIPPLKLLYHVLWFNKRLLNLNLKILWWYDEGNIVKKAWWSDGRMDGQTEWTYSQSCLWSQLKNVKLNQGIPVDTKRSFSFVPYLLWYPVGQELGYLILELYIESY